MTPKDVATSNYPALTTVSAMVVIILVMLSLITVLRRYSADTAFLSPRFVIALVVVFAFTGLTAYSAVFPLPESEPAGQMIGALIASFTIVITSFFPSSTAAERPSDAHN